MSLVNNLSTIKYVIQNVADQYGKSVTFVLYPIENVIKNIILQIYFLAGKYDVNSCILEQNIRGLLVFTNPSVNGFRKLGYIEETMTISENSIYLNAIDSNINLDFLILLLLIVLNDHTILLPKTNSTSFIDNFKYMSKNNVSCTGCLKHIHN